MSNAPERWADPRWTALERVIIRLRERPAVLWGPQDDAEGLNFNQINHLAGRAVFGSEPYADENGNAGRWVIVHHPRGADPVRYRVVAGWLHLAAAPEALSLTSRIITYLQAWQAVLTEQIDAQPVETEQAEGSEPGRFLAEGEQSTGTEGTASPSLPVSATCPTLRLAETGRPEAKGSSMSYGIDDIFRRAAAEASRRQAEEQQYEESRKKRAAVNALLVEIEHFSSVHNRLRNELGREPTESELNACYAGFLIQYCRAVREADLAADIPDLTPAEDRTQLGLAVVRYAWLGNSQDIVSLLHRAEREENRRLANGMIEAIIDLLYQLRGTPRRYSGGWVETDSADAGTTEGTGASSVRTKSEQAEGAGAASDQADTVEVTVTPSEEPEEREREILVALLLLGAVTERRRVSRRKAARKADSDTVVSIYNRPIAALGKRGLLCSKKGPNGGIWLTPNGKTAAQSLQEKTHQ